jgi:4-amino-4-deoxy-L-arabinose transferase-like glycosyltransferase
VKPTTASDHSYETSGDRASLAREAGVGKLSFISVLAGTLVAYGAFAILAALVGAAATAIGLTNDLSSNDWARLGTGSAIAAAVVLFLAYLFGGYVAGRMARRAGLLNGLAVLLLAIVLIAAVGALVASQADADAIRTNLRSLGVPTSGSEWSDIGTLAGIASLAAMLLGALVGGVLGERWHSKLTRRAVSGKYSPEPDDRPTTGERASTGPPGNPDEPHQAAPGRSERDRAGGGGASRVD